MKNILKLFVAFVFLSAPMAYAADPFEGGFSFGISSPDFEEPAGSTIDGNAGYVVGGTFFKKTSESFSLRVGGHLTNNPATIELTGFGLEADIEVLTLNVPITAMYNLSEGFGLFVGPQIGIVVSDDCTGDSTICDDFDTESITTAVTLGVHARVHPNWGLDAFYTTKVEVAEDTEFSSLGILASFIY